MENITFNCRRRHSSSLRKLKKKFPDKLWSVVSDENESSCIWSPDGDSLLINKGKFTQRFLTNSNGLFRTSKFKSFVRQLNLYGFRKVNKMRRRDHEIWWEYQNENFIRDHPELLKLIKRKANIEEYYDCENCSKSRSKRKTIPANTALDLRLALFDDSCDHECQNEESKSQKELKNETLGNSEEKVPISIKEMDFNFSDDESRPAVNVEPFVINIPLSQKQMWENNENYLTFSLFPDLPFSQDANPMMGTNSDENIPIKSKSQIRSQNLSTSEYSF